MTGGAEYARSEYSQIISIVRFPLIISLVFVHFDLSEMGEIRALSGSYPVELPTLADALMFATGHLFAGVRVACFFVISGFLFFLTLKPTVDGFAQKFKNRVNTLLVPFLIWNLVYLLYGIVSWYIRYKIAGASFFWEHDDIASLSMSDLLIETLWARPACGAMWYIRELMLLVGLSPILNLIIRGKWWGTFVGLLGILWMIPSMHSFQLSTGGVGGLLLYSFGGGISTHHIDCLKLIRHKSISTLFFAVAILDIVSRGNDLYMWVHTQTIVMAMIWIFHLAYMANRNGYEVKQWMHNSTFFVFAIHQMIIGVFSQTLVSIIEPNKWQKQLLLWLMVTLMVVVLSLAASEVVRRTAPGLHKIMTGNR